MEGKLQVIVDSARGLDGADRTLAARFLSEIERIISLLRHQRFLRLSLFRFEFVGVAMPDAVRLVDVALRRHGLVGTLQDGSSGFLFLGPRGQHATADLALLHHIAERLRIQTQRYVSSGAIRLRSTTVVHRWADEVVDACGLVKDLCQPRVEKQAS